jgi:predicted nucleic acid-binding protein
MAASPAAAPLAVLLDTNVLLDVLLAREPWAAEAARLLDVIATGRVQGFVASHALTTIFSLVQRARDAATARTIVADLLTLLAVVPLDRTDFLRALGHSQRDYQDAVQVAAALRAGAGVLVTRNPKAFANAPVAVRAAGEVLAALAQGPRATRPRRRD